MSENRREAQLRRLFNATAAPGQPASVVRYALDTDSSGRDPRRGWWAYPFNGRPTFLGHSFREALESFAETARD